jgi:hypothetical protein
MSQDDSVELRLEEGKISISILQDDINSIKLEMEHISFSIEISQRDKFDSVILINADFKPFQMIEQFRERNIYVHVEKSALSVSLELLNYDYVVLIFPTITQKILKKLTGKRVVIIGGKLKENKLKLDDGLSLSKGLSLSTEMTSQYFIDDCPEGYTCIFNENTLRIGDGFYPRLSLAVAAYTSENSTFAVYPSQCDVDDYSCWMKVNCFIDNVLNSTQSNSFDYNLEIITPLMIFILGIISLMHFKFRSLF